MEGTKHPPHEWFYCDHCERWSVLCGQCGNNSCNGGRGEVMGPEPGTTMECPACESAYRMDMDEEPPAELTSAKARKD